MFTELLLHTDMVLGTLYRETGFSLQQYFKVGMILFTFKKKSLQIRKVK